jgi:putative hydrolase of the HAD superfamily
MIGNSVKSDILPVIALGGSAIHIPYESTWIHERVADDAGSSTYLRLNSIHEVATWLGSGPSSPQTPTMPSRIPALSGSCP